jgi:hypothetical protein
MEGNSDGIRYKVIYEEMRKFFTIYEEAVSHMTLHPIPLNFHIYEENFIFSFISKEFKQYSLS